MNLVTKQALDIFESLGESEKDVALAFLQQLLKAYEISHSERNEIYLAKIRRGIQQCAEGDWVVRFRDLKGALTGAATHAEAVEEAEDCLGSWLSLALEEGQNIPEPTAVQPDEELIAVPSWTAPKVVRYLECRAALGHLAQNAFDAGLYDSVGIPEGGTDE